MPPDIRVQPQAFADIENAVAKVRDWISEASADRLHDGLWAKIRSIAEFPVMWPLAEEADDLGIELRQVLYGKRRQVYRILYTFDGTTIRVHRVRLAAQDRLTADDL